jgi:alkanesulfonate monooxygenase SsuD/methylene tetrahydromethanopterin reductase-like flavin-dependent oxidoreductase (luciferase family)
MFIGLNSKRLKANTLGYVLPTHNPVRVAEEIATLDHVLKGRLSVGFTRGYQARWFQNYAAVRGVHATHARPGQAPGPAGPDQSRDLRGIGPHREDRMDQRGFQL